MRTHIGPHCAQGFGDAFHGPLHQGCIANQPRVEFLRGQQPGEQAHRGARVSHIEGPAGALQAMQAHAVDQHASRAGLFDVHAQGAHGREARQAILAGKKAVRLR